MPKRVDRAAKREQLVEAALAAFAEGGFAGTAMETIAAHAGVSKGLLYQYFDDKSDLFFACFDAWLQRAITDAGHALAQAGGDEEPLLILAHAGLRSAREHMELYPLMFEVYSAAGSGNDRGRFAAALRTMYTRYRGLLAELLREGVAAGRYRRDLDVEAVAALLTGAVDGLLLQFWLQPNLDVDVAMAGFGDALLRGLRADGSPQ